MKNYTLVPRDSEFGEIINDFAKRPQTALWFAYKYNSLYPISIVGETYRTINYWGQKGLFFHSQASKGLKWRKINLVELIWVYIIKELRTIGFSVESIKKIKDCLFPSGVEKNDLSPVVLYYLMISEFPDIEEVYLIADATGRADFCLKFEYYNTSQIDNIAISHVAVNVTKLNSIINKKELTYNKHRTYYPLSEKELSLINKIKSTENLKEVNLKVDGGEIKRLDLIKKVQNPSDVYKLIRTAISDNLRKEIIIKQEDNGKIALIEQRDKQ